MIKELKKRIKKQKRLIKEFLNSRIKLYKSELRIYKYLQKMEENNSMYFPLYMRIESIVNQYKKEIERLENYAKQF